MWRIHASSINCILPPGHFVWICTDTHTLVHTKTHLCGSNTFLEWQKPGIIFCYLLLQMQPSFHDPAVSLHPPPACVHLFRFLSLSLSFLAMAPLLMFMFIQTHLPLSILAPTSSSLPHCTRVSSFCYKPRFHNNCDLSIMPNHF